MNINSPKRILVSAMAIVVLLMAAGLVLWLSNHWWPTTCLRHALAHGDSSVHVVSIVVQSSDASVRMIIDEPEFISAVNQSLHSGAGGTESVMKQWPDLHHTYQATVLMASGHEARVRLSVFRNDDGIAVEIVAPYAILDDTYPYWIPFRQPIPDSVKKILERLRTGKGSEKGSVGKGVGCRSS